MTKREMMGSALAMMAFLPTATLAQAPVGVPAPEDIKGDEVFGPGYLPSDPDNMGEPLEVGHPAAGFTGNAMALPQRRLDPRWFLTEGIKDNSFPLRRSIQKQLKLPKFKVNRASGAVAGTGGDGGFKAAPMSVVATMRVHYVNVGQGAGAIVEFPKGCGIAVIDTGGEFGTQTNGGALFAKYLNAFFDDRPDINRTIDALYTSHPHKDHMYGLSYIVPAAGAAAGQKPITVRNIVDNGQTGIEGSLLEQTRARSAARKAGAGYAAIRLQDQNSATGSTNKVIDPFACQPVDPIITAFWGSRNEMISSVAPQRVHKYSNPNEHSVVLRIDFGDASFLFTGDLMKDGLKDMLTEYSSNRGVFQADVYHVGHHGADNGTSPALLKQVRPRIAIISVGSSLPKKPHAAWDHGHPRLTTISFFQGTNGVSDTRPAVTYWGATADGNDNPDNFESVKVTHAIYATGWEGSVILEARSDRFYKVILSKP